MGGIGTVPFVVLTLDGVAVAVALVAVAVAVVVVVVMVVVVVVVIYDAIYVANSSIAGNHISRSHASTVHRMKRREDGDSYPCDESSATRAGSMRCALRA